MPNAGRNNVRPSTYCDNPPRVSLAIAFCKNSRFALWCSSSKSLNRSRLLPQNVIENSIQIVFDLQMLGQLHAQFQLYRPLKESRQDIWTTWSTSKLDMRVATIAEADEQDSSIHRENILWIWSKCSQSWHVQTPESRERAKSFVSLRVGQIAKPKFDSGQSKWIVSVQGTR